MIEVVSPGFEWSNYTNATLPLLTKHLEQCGRVCWKSEDKITEDSADKFIRKICRNSHESVLEHGTLTARIVCSRAASHQLVRHRIGAYSQESQRYVNYDEYGIKVVCPPSIGVPPGRYAGYHYVKALSKSQNAWVEFMQEAGRRYTADLKENNVKPEDARYALPNAIKTELMVTYNLRTWRHVIKERALNPKAQWEIREIFLDIMNDLKFKLPAIFEDLE